MVVAPVQLLSSPLPRSSLLKSQIESKMLIVLTTATNRTKFELVHKLIYYLHEQLLSTLFAFRKFSILTIATIMTLHKISAHSAVQFKATEGDLEQANFIPGSRHRTSTLFDISKQ